MMATPLPNITNASKVKNRFRVVQLREGRYRGDVVDIPLIDPAQDVAAERPR